MDEKSKSEELIDKLIKKRRLENDAFLKLLDAMSNKKIEAIEKDKGSENKKSPKP